MLLFLHVAAAVIWLGAGFLIAVLVFGAERAGNRQKEAGHHQDVAWLAPRLFVPASLASSSSASCSSSTATGASINCGS